MSIQTVFDFAVQYQAFVSVRTDLKIAKEQVVFLSYLLASKSGVASLDDITSDLGLPFDGGGKWRGSVTLRLSLDGIIEHAGVIRSARQSRNAGLIHRWRLADPRRAKIRVETLRNWIGSIENPPTATVTGGEESEVPSE